jgi:hypothetical protein
MIPINSRGKCWGPGSKFCKTLDEFSAITLFGRHGKIERQFVYQKIDADSRKNKRLNGIHERFCLISPVLW